MISRWITIGLVIGFGLLAWGGRDDIQRALQAARPVPIENKGGYGRATVSFSDTSIQALIPTTGALQAKGLAGRTHLTDKEGMLWLYPSPGFPAFWMKDMQIPIDILWIRGQVIVDLAIAVPAPTEGQTDLPVYRPSQSSDAVLEVAAGFAGRYQVEIGERITIDRH